MFRYPLITLPVLFLLLSGCMLNRSGLGPAPGEFGVRPTLACPGDTVLIDWDLQVRAHPGFCRFANGNTPSLQSCSSASDCARGASCVDGQCNACAAIANVRNRTTDCATPSSAGCLPNMNARIELTPEPTPALERARDIWNEHSGGRQFVIEETTHIGFFSEVVDIDGQRAGVPGSLGRFDAGATVVVVDPSLTRTSPHPYECRGMPTWADAALDELFAGASDRLRVVSVRNPNGFAVEVSGLTPTPLILAPGAAQTLNMRVSGRVDARPDAAHLATLPPVMCTAVQSSGSYPDAPLELTVGCQP
ncbi:hypothetical protein [Pseudomonas benzenivorans]|uniref:Uncharacterized protein n=1 Tax=Pseudomonas benzenivorans TaxID=556533 RepID=A0ABY5H1W5_9PSED|nr:hypothetical protein [Pseudomonas benzenivorans]UTW05857.1 hypothetical protein KDW96_11705 [Pseudomonas benzenivorans]